MVNLQSCLHKSMETGKLHRRRLYENKSFGAIGNVVVLLDTVGTWQRNKLLTVNRTSGFFKVNRSMGSSLL